MAIVTLTIVEGRDEQTLTRLHKALAEAVIRELPAKPGQVRTIIQQVPAIGYAIGGTPLDAAQIFAAHGDRAEP